jgi:hypothetical protein
MASGSSERQGAAEDRRPVEPKSPVRVQAAGDVTHRTCPMYKNDIDDDVIERWTQVVAVVLALGLGGLMVLVASLHG